MIWIQRVKWEKSLLHTLRYVISQKQLDRIMVLSIPSRAHKDNKNKFGMKKLWLFKIGMERIKLGTTAGWEVSHDVVSCAAQTHKLRVFHIFKGVVSCFRSFSASNISRAPKKETLACLSPFGASPLFSHLFCVIFVTFKRNFLARLNFGYFH